jgi:hypothetical protein
LTEYIKDEAKEQARRLRSTPPSVESSLKGWRRVFAWDNVEQTEFTDSYYEQWVEYAKTLSTENLEKRLEDIRRGHENSVGVHTLKQEIALARELERRDSLAEHPPVEASKVMQGLRKHSWEVEGPGPIQIPVPQPTPVDMPDQQSITAVIRDLETGDRDNLLDFLYNDRQEAIESFNNFWRIVAKDEGPQKIRQYLRSHYKGLQQLCSWINTFGHSVTFLRRLDRAFKAECAPTHGDTWEVKLSSLLKRAWESPVEGEQLVHWYAAKGTDMCDDLEEEIAAAKKGGPQPLFTRYKAKITCEYCKAQRLFEILLAAHQHEGDRRHAEFYNLGAATDAYGIYSKTSHGGLESQIDPATEHVTHEWLNND